MNIGIIGIGIVGGATAEVLERAHKIERYDKYKEPHNYPRNLESIAKEAELVFVCVPTPMKISGEMDYSAINNSLDALAKETDKAGRDPKKLLVTIRSTAVSGTTDKLAEKYRFPIAFNPEFLTEKNAVEDMKNTERVVLGVEDEESKNKLLMTYQPVFPNAKYFVVSRKEAEMIKYAANVMLAMQIASANEIYKICEAVGVDYDRIRRIILHDARIGRNIQVPGPDGNLGFGGKCFPKDLNALIHLARESGYNPYLLEEAWRLNLSVRERKDWLDIPGATTENNNFGKK